MNKNILSDRQWDIWARELRQLQSDYPDISKKVDWYDDFADWDASTGAFLPLDNDFVKRKASYILKICNKCDTERPKKQNDIKQVRKGKLF